MAEQKKSGDSSILLQGAEEVLTIDAHAWNYIPSLEDNSLVMAYAVDALAASQNVHHIVFHQRKRYTYPYDQTKLLLTIAKLYDHLVKGKKILSLATLGYEEQYTSYFTEKRGALQTLVYTLLRTDHLGLYIDAQRFPF